MTKKLAVIVMNLGGPLKKQDIRPFLFNFFMDKNIIKAPVFIRFFLALYISLKRSKGEALTAYKQLNYKSPLLENTEKQAEALEKQLNSEKFGFDEVKVFVSMRYWNPMSSEVVKKVKRYDPDNVILLPLYPQYSTATSKSSIENWTKTAKKLGLNCETKSICCYPLDKGFIKASSDNILEAYNNAKKANPEIKYRLLFSAHGLPEKTIKSGDPYQWQCEQSAKFIAKETGIENLDWQICYQSRVGPLEWIKPSTTDSIKQAGDDNLGVIVYPHAFVSEHVETIIEIDKEYRELSKKHGVKDFIKVDTVGVNPEFISGLSRIVIHASKENKNVNILCPDPKTATCIKNHKECYYNKGE